MTVTIADVAAFANVSKATVSAVLNNKPSVSEKTRKKVLEAIAKLNYRPNQFARSLSSRQTRSIGLVVKEIDNPYFARVMKGVFDACCNHGYTVLLGSSELSPAHQTQNVETMTHQHVDGLIISPLQGDDVDYNYLSALLNDSYPLVTLGTVQNHATSVVEIDNSKAAHKAVSYLMELGHRKIAYFTGSPYSTHSRERLDGYKQAHIDRNLTIYKDFIVTAGSYIDDGYRRGMSFFGETKELPTAVFCFNDLVAIGLVNALTELGMRVPDDVSVIGFDDIDIASSVRVPLTSVHVPAYDIGTNAANLLIELIRDREKSYHQRVVLQTELIVRESCAALS
jgi:LacI family transcriptional regulator/LacI family repressor for deo operon, udp, cdd, tsx, nupC, and nupG